LQIPPSGSGTFYVRLLTAGFDWEPPATFLGAEFKIEGLPVGWSAIVVPSPESAGTSGDPLGPIGADVALPNDVTGDCILLYSVTLIPPTSGASAELHVTQRTPSTLLEAQCPFVIGPDRCEFCWACVDGGILYVNIPGDCQIGVEPSTWSRVKTLYER
jgi:hypothetical protein